MSEVLGFWHIKEFSEKVNEIFQTTYPNEKTHQNTIALWFKDLEEKMIHYVNRDKTRIDWKVFDELDLAIALFIADKRLKSTGKQAWTLMAIYNVLPGEFELRSFPLEHKINPNTIDIEQLFTKISKDVRESMQEDRALNEKMIKNQTQLFLEQSKVNETKQRKTLIDMLEFQSNARKEAIKEWESFPEDRRFIKRLFSKSENWAERERFITECVERETLYWLNKMDESLDNDSEV